MLSYPCYKVDQVKGENATLYNQFTNVDHQFMIALNDNRVLKSNGEAFRIKVAVFNLSTDTYLNNLARTKTLSKDRDRQVDSTCNPSSSILGIKIIQQAVKMPFKQNNHYLVVN